jgi:hypothetical protein
VEHAVGVPDSAREPKMLLACCHSVHFKLQELCVQAGYVVVCVLFVAGDVQCSTDHMCKRMLFVYCQDQATSAQRMPLCIARW